MSSQDRGDQPADASNVARIDLICGCMFSGKTTELLRRLSAYAPGSVQVFKHTVDGRYGQDRVGTHTGKTWPAIPIQHVAEIREHLTPGTERLAIDEGHFFGNELVGAVRALSSEGIAVTVTALDRDSWGRPFPAIERLLAISDRPLIRHASCGRCGQPADRTQRLTPIVNGSMVGGPESYEPRCEECWEPPPEPPPVM